MPFKDSIKQAMILSIVLITNEAYSQQTGKTLVSRGKVTAQSDDATNLRNLKRRSPVYDVDIVNTGEQGQAQIKMNDGALLALKENTTLAIKEYSYDGESGSVAMELITGGLRTISGKIKGVNGKYKLETPVGSIGIRGTHYEIEYVNEQLNVAVWDGSIDLDTGDSEQGITILGDEGKFSFATIDKNGTVTELLEAPDVLTEVKSSDEVKESSTETESSEESQDQEVDSATGKSLLTEMTVTNENADSGSEGIDDFDDVDDPEWINELITEVEDQEAISDLIEQRTGTAQYSTLVNQDISSSVGSISNFDISLSVNFDDGFVEDGVLSLDDSGGEWFATFNGILNKKGMTLGVNYASHGQNVAFGTIEAQFGSELEQISGGFNLQEVNNDGIFVNGLFVLSEDK
jgi:hypothetical protein